jgi:uncharacterized protein (UPF0548 family)
MTSTFTYAEVGATRQASLPAGYHHLERRVPVASGDAGFRAAADDVVWLTVRAFTRPATLLTRLGGPVGRLLQRRVTTQYANALRGLAAGT